jgi:acyl dehydratase
MTEVSEVMEKLGKLIGTTTPPGINEVEKGAIRRYAEAVGDPNPLYSDVEYARHSKYKEIICPPGFFGWPAKVSVGAMEIMAPIFEILFSAGLFRILDGGIDYDFFLPIRAGDTLIWYARFADAKERTSKSGERMVFITMELTFINQNGDTVARRRQTFIAR